MVGLQVRAHGIGAAFKMNGRGGLCLGKMRDEA